MLDVNGNVPGICQTHFDVVLVWMASSLAAFEIFVAGSFDDIQLLVVAVVIWAGFCCLIIE